MNATNLIQLARAKKRDRVLGFLNLAFNDFAYPVYLFGSYATGQFHGYSDVDIVIIAPDTLAKKVYRQACIQMAELGMNYDILIVSSINRLNSSIVSSLQAVSATAPSCDDLDNCSRHDSTPLLHRVVPAQSMQSNISDQPRQASPSPYRNQQGLTLVELMIAMLLGLFLLGGLLQIFISSRHTSTMQEGLSRLQENGRFAIDFLARDIRLAGYKGCSSRSYETSSPSNSILDIQNPPDPTTDFLYDFNTAIQGFEAISTTAWSPGMVPDTQIPSPLGSSDVITIRRADEQGFSVTAHSFDKTANTSALTLEPATATTENLQAAGFLTTGTTPENKCATAVVSNCQTAKVFQVSDITGNILEHNDTAGNCTSGSSNTPPGNRTNDLSTPYLGGQVRQINTISYFIRTTPAKIDPATLTPTDQISLYRRVGANDAQELVEGVERMEILYGVDTDVIDTPNYGSANYYVKADTLYVAGDPVATAANWAKVVSVRISLLVATVDEIAAQPLTYTYNAVTVTPADRKLRRVFTTTIALRNRVP